MRKWQPHEYKDNMAGLRSAFTYDVRPEIYISNATWTAILVGVALAGLAAWRNETINPLLIAPLNGWHAKNPDGALYIEIWANILANSVQVGFGLWGAVLFCLGLGRLLFAQKFIRSCFAFAIVFLIIAFGAPPLVQFAFTTAIDTYPELIK